MRWMWMVAGGMGTAAVALGAFGAHALAGRIDARGERLWGLGSAYLLMHATAVLALCASASASQAGWARSMGWAAGALAAGASLFAASLFGLALGGPRALGAIAPIGGVAMLWGWATVLWAAFRAMPR